MSCMQICIIFRKLNVIYDRNKNACTGLKVKKKEKNVARSGNRTLVSCVTGRDTNHYTNPASGTYTVDVLVIPGAVESDHIVHYI